MEYIAAGPQVSLYAALLLILALGAAVRFGRMVLGFFTLPVLRRGEVFLFSIALGLLAQSLGLLGLGVAGLLSRTAVGALYLIFFAAPFLVRASGAAQAVESVRWSLWDRAMACGLVFVFFLAFVDALRPSTGVDALAYHLYIPEEFLRIGRMDFLPLTRESLWPFNTEMLFMAGLLFQGTALAQLFHWIFYPLIAMAVYLLVRRFYGSKQALWAAVFFVMTPAAFAQSSYPYVDLSLAFFVFLSVYAFLLPGGSPSRAGDYALCGVFCGAAIGTKLLGLGCFGLLFLMAAYRARWNLKVLGVFAGLTLMVGGGWYLRSWVLAGNPVYPFFHSFFGGHGWFIAMDQNVGMGNGWKAFLLFPWNTAMFPVKFGGQMIGPLFLMLVPALFYPFRLPRSHSRDMIIFTLAFTIFLFTQSQHMRFYIAVAPFLAVGAGVAWTQIMGQTSLARYASALAVGAVLLMHTGIYVHRTQKAWPVVLGKIEARDWLTQHERSFKGFDYIQKHVAPDAKVFNGAEVRYFYAPLTHRIVHHPQIDVGLKKAGVLLGDYLKKNDFDCIWISDSSDPAMSDFVKTHGYQPVFEYTFTEKPDTFYNQIYAHPRILAAEKILNPALTEKI